MTQPNLLTRAKTALYAWRNGLGMPKTKASPYAWPAWRDKQPLWQLIDYDAYVGEGFNRNSLVYSAIMYKFMAMTQAPMRAYTGTRENPELLPETHPLAKLLARPNSHQSWVEYHGLSVVYMNLHGNAYTFMDKPPGSRGRLPDALVPLRPDRVYIVPANDGGRASLLGYIYVPEGRSAWEQYSQSERARRIQNGDVALIPTDQMIHVKLPNPGDPLEGMGYGLSPLAAAGQAIDVDNAITSFIKTFFQRGGVPPFWFTFDVPLDDNTLADLRQYIGEQYGGFDNWTRPGVLDQGGKIERLGMSFDEMGFDGLDARNETRILSALGVTPILLGARIGLERSTMANYQESRRQFWEDRMLSESRLFEVEYQYYLRDGDAFPMFDMTEVPALQRNVPELADAAYKLWTMGVPAQSALATAGLEVEDLPAGDVGFVPIGVQPIGRSIEPPKPVPPQLQQPQQQGESEEGAASVEDEEPPKKGRGPAERTGLTDAAKDLTWKRVDQIAQSWEARFADMARRQFEIDERELLALMHKAQVTALERKATVDWMMIEQDAMYYLSQAGERWRSAFIPLLQGVVTEQANAWNVQYGMAFDVRNLFALRWWDEYTLKFAQPIMDTTKADITNVLRLAMDEGWSIPRMQNNLETLFQQWMTGNLSPEAFQWFEQRLPPYRTEMLARTETIRASNAGSEALYRAWNVQYKEWLTAIDERACPWCLEMNGKVLATGDKWFSKDDTFTVGEGENAQVLKLGFEDISRPPLHPNCRCTLIPVVGEQAIAAAQQAGAEQGMTRSARDDVTSAIANARPDWTPGQIDQMMDTLSLDEETFVRYARQMGIDGADDLASRFFEYERELTRQQAAARWDDVASRALPFRDQHVAMQGFSDDYARAIGRDRAESIEDMLDHLSTRFGVRVSNLNATDEATLHRQLSELLNVLDDNPAVARTMNDHVSTIIYRDARQNIADANMSYDNKTRAIEIYPERGYATPSSAWVHEIGHAAEEYNKSAYLYERGFGQGNVASIYGATNQSEDFAELFTAVHSRMWTQGQIMEWMPDKYRFILDTVPGLRDWLMP